MTLGQFKKQHGDCKNSDISYDEACFMHLTPGVVHNFPKSVSECIGFLSPIHKKIPDFYLKREGGNLGNSGLSSQQYMVVHYPRTVWKNCYAEHEVTGKTYN